MALRQFYLFLTLSVLLALPITLCAQPGGDDEWSEDWTLDSLDQDSFDFAQDVIYRTARGFFATPNRGMSLSLRGTFIYSDVFELSSGIRTSAFRPTTEAFGRSNPYDCSILDWVLTGKCREREILAANSDEAADGGYPESGFSEYALDFDYNFPFPAVLRASLAYRSVSGLLFSEDTSRAYLSLDGSRRSFREIGVVHHQQHVASGQIGLKIPVYGAFIESDLTTIGSYYYLYGGLGADYALLTSTRQYTQIADAKDQIRYGNGQDTVTLMHTSNSDDIQAFRTSIELGIGWTFSAEVITLGTEIFASLPTVSLLSDAEWKELYGGFRIQLGYYWGGRGGSL